MTEYQLPEWAEVSGKKEAGETLTPLEEFIFENEPAGSEEDEFRTGLLSALAPLLEDLAAHEASNRIKTENLDTLRQQLADAQADAASWQQQASDRLKDWDALREQNGKLREALRWTVASLSAAASAYQKHASRHNTVRPRSVSDPFFTTRSRDFAAAVEVARAALGESE